MKISLNWLREFTFIPDNVDPQSLGKLFTAHTAEVEQVESEGASFDKMVVGQILEVNPHPNADKLRITRTNVGGEILQIVCGAPNIFAGQFVPVALPGSKVRWHGEGDLITLEPTKIRGVESYGMICAAEEIGLPPAGDGIVDLSALNPKAGTPLAEIFGKNDTVLTVDNKSLTHRPDLWGHYGIAREMSAIFKLPLKAINTDVAIPAQGESPNIEVKGKKICPRYIGIYVDGIKVDPSPEWLQKKLNTIGYKSISNIVDVTNLVMAEIGQPLHAFDATKIDTGIIVRNAKKNEKIKTLDGQERTLSEEMLVIADHKKALAIAGVMGGEDSEINNDTTKILIESANFDPSSVRKTSVKIGLRTEAVQRFEKSLDPNLAETAIKLACKYILEICPTARICGPAVDIKNYKEKKNIVSVNLKRVLSKIGVAISTEEIIDILTRLEFKPTLASKDKLKVEIPSFRATKDISIEDDLVEEIARMHGYNNITPVLPDLPIRLPIANIERKLKHKSRQIFAEALGFDEVYNHSFYSLIEIKKCHLIEEAHLQLLNYLSEDQTHLRTSLLPNILKNIGQNLKQFNEFKLFEIGHTYTNLQEFFPLEEKKICAAVVLSKKNQTDPFYIAKGALETYLKLIGFNTNTLKMDRISVCPYAHPNKLASFKLKKDDTEIARIFELHPSISKNYDLTSAKIAIIEVNFSAMVKEPFTATKFKAIPKFPGIRFDVSVSIDKKIEIGTVEKSIANCDKNLIKEVKLFDLYEGPNVDHDKKALAFSILLQSPERTLTDEEMKATQQKVFTKLTEIGGEIRGSK